MKKRVVLSLILIFGFILFSSFVYAACSFPNQTILKLSSITNAHGEFYNGAGNYPIEICYDTIFGVVGNGNRTCSAGNGNLVLKLSSDTNAHAEIPTLNNYLTKVCYGDLNCTNQITDCIEPYELVVSLSSETNAHLSNGLDYSVKICCKVPFPPEEKKLYDAYWTDINDVKIMVAEVGQQVKLVVEGIPDGELVNFDIWEKETLTNQYATTLQETIRNGKANITWVVSDVWDEGLFDNLIYFFNASLDFNPSISNLSTDLDIVECVPFNCEQIAASQGVNEVCGIWPDNCGGTVDCSGCSGGLTCAYNPDGSGVCQNLGTITACEDYSNQLDCGNFTPQIAIDTVINNGGSCSDYTGGDGCFYDITCVCKWDDTNGCYGSQEQIKDCPGLPPVTGSCDMLSRILKGCEEPPLGFKTIEITKIISGEGNPNDWEPPCEGTQVLEKKCIDRVLLKFFNTANLIIAILIIIVFYLIVVKKKKKYRRQKGKKRQENKKRKK